jgi:hypothetical protein
MVRRAVVWTTVPRPPPKPSPIAPAYQVAVPAPVQPAFPPGLAHARATWPLALVAVFAHPPPALATTSGCAPLRVLATRTALRADEPREDQSARSP